MATDPKTLDLWRRKAALRYARHRDTLIVRRQARRRRRLDYINQKKLEIGACADCGIEVEEWNTMCFAFDHLDPATKLFSPSKGQMRSEQAIDEELAKCELVCHNCHAIRTYVLRDHGELVRQRLNPHSALQIHYKGLQLELFTDEDDDD